MTKKSRLVRVLAITLGGMATLGAAVVFSLYVLIAVRGPLWRPTIVTFLVTVAVGAVGTALLSGGLNRPRRDAIRASLAVVLVGVLISAAAFKVGSRPCDKLLRLEQECAESGECLEYKAYGDELFAAMCKSSPFLCKYTHHRDPDLTRDDITYRRSCGELPCPKEGFARCVSPTRVEVCRQSEGWVGSNCAGKCLDSLPGPGGAGCELIF